MGWLHWLLKIIHRVLHFVAAILHRLFGAFWMKTPPPLVRDWSTNPPDLGPPPVGAPHPPEFDPAEVYGNFLGTIMRIEVPTKWVQPLLPNGVIMPARASAAGYLHGVNLAFGFQSNVHPDGLNFLPGCNYMEFVLGIPNVYLEQPINGFKGPCAVLTRLELNQLLPVILGRALGLPKFLSRIMTTENSFRVVSFWRSILWINGVFNPHGTVCRPAALPNFSDIISTFSQPGVSHAPGLGLIFSQYKWYWDLGIGQETEAIVNIHEGWGGGRYTRQNGIGENCPGAWRVKVPWTMEAYSKPQAGWAATTTT
jgi:hypothetical protein